jgi:hypothetical protein
MGLIDLKTNLKSLKFGNDRFGGGSSGQPYIQTPIPNFVGNQNNDFILRGGILSPILAAFDSLRLSKYFFDLKSPSGFLFTAKQNILSLQNVNSVGFPRNTNLLTNSINGGIYLPSNTIAQALVNPLGINLPKQGLLPIPPSDQEKYFYITRDLQNGQSNLNRLNLLYESKILKNSQITSKIFGINSTDGDTILLKYPGGPNSFGGVGNTVINISNPTINSTGSVLIPFPNTGKFSNSTSKTYQVPISSSIKFIDGSPEKYALVSGSYVSENYANKNSNFSGDNFQTYAYNLNDINNISENSEKTRLIKNNPITNIQDFRKNLIEDNKIESSTILSISPNYSTKNIENRVNLGDPGSRTKNRMNYTSGSGEALDKITFLPIYKSSAHNKDYNGNDANRPNDLVSFRIAIIDNDAPNLYTFIHFRAFIDSISDSHNSEWSSTNYVGRGEDFFNYVKYGRNISLAFTVPAQSKEELIPMYKKLNYLASSLAPSYNQNNGGFMRGNIAKLTIGGYVYEQPGIIRSLTYDIPQESPWEIAINTEGNIDKSVKELPHIIRVSSFNFTPIHSFLPSLQVNEYDNNGNVVKYGNSRFISLKSSNDNYDS